MRLWHLPCVYRGAPLVEIRIRLSSPAFLTFPPNVTHAFFVLWRDACAACAAGAEAAGLSLHSSNTSVNDDKAGLRAVEEVTMIVKGFSGSTPRFAADTFQCLAQMCCNLAALERHHMQQPQPLLHSAGGEVEMVGVKGQSDHTAGEPATMPALVIAMQDCENAMHGSAPDLPPVPGMHHEDVAEGELMGKVALRALKGATTAQLDEVCTLPGLDKVVNVCSTS